MPLTGGTPRAFLADGHVRAILVAGRRPPRLHRFLDAGDPLSIADRTGADARPIDVR